MNFLYVGWIDCGGNGKKWSEIFSKYSKKHTFRCLVEKTGNLYYKPDLTPDSPELHKVIEKTDVFIFCPVIKNAHLTNGLINDGLMSNICGINWQKITEGKQVYACLAGSVNLRNNAEEYNRILQTQYQKVFCSTPDLKKLFPFANYLPNPLDLTLEKFKPLSLKERKKLMTGKFKICHFPTNRPIKNTDDYINVCSELSKEIEGFTWHDISNYTNEEVMELKKRSHLCFDHMQGYYGINSIEAAAIGCIPLVGINAEAREMLKEYVGSKTLPFDTVRNIEELKNTIRYYSQMSNKDFEKRSKEVSSWMQKYWQPQDHFEKFERMLVDEPVNKATTIDSRDYITFLTTTYNRQDNLRNALHSIAYQNLQIPYEILVVDDGSTDQTLGVIEEFKKTHPKMVIRTIYYKKVETFRNPGIPHNAGLIYAKGNLIIQSGADVIVGEGTAQKLYDAFKREEGLYSAKLYTIEEAKVKKVVTTSEKRFFNSVNKLKKARTDVHYCRGDKANATPFCAIYKKEWAHKIGLYDEEYAMGGGDDCDFIYRLQTVAKTRWLLDAEAVHQDHPKYGGFRRSEENYARNILRLNKSKKGIENRWRKRILFLGSFNMYKTPGFLWDSLKQSFMRLGHECVFYDPNPVCETSEEMKSQLPNYPSNWDKNSDEIRRIVEEFKPEIVIGGIPKAFEIMKELRSETDAFFVCWFGDMRSPESFGKWKGIFDIMFLTNEGQVLEYSKLLSIPVCPVTFGVLGTAHHKNGLKKKYDIGFTGQIKHKLHKRRNALIQQIQEKHHVEFRNENWFETFDFYNECKILISDNCDYAHDNQIRNYTSNRFFNIVGCGGLCIVRHFPGLELLGENKKHFAWFKDDDECLELIDYYLKNESEAEEIRENAYDHFHRYHNWDSKVAKMNDEIRNHFEMREEKQ